jgi:hypothetical protein
MKTRKRANKSPYTGELATPIYEPVPFVGGLGGGKAEAERRTREQQILKMEKLFDWYSIGPDEPDAGMSLAVKLALAHVPGMQVLQEPPKRRGRKRSWKDGLGIELVRDVEALRQTEKMTDEGHREAPTRQKEAVGFLHAGQSCHSSSRGTQGGATSEIPCRTIQGIANFASHGGGVRDGSSLRNRRKFKRSKLVGDENCPRYFCVGAAFTDLRLPMTEHGTATENTKC